ncbi:hypothetical protein [Actinokineospora pegani]|nr:hypothetical protein [Actinokineospora pegani]
MTALSVDRVLAGAVIGGLVWPALGGAVVLAAVRVGCLRLRREVAV